MPNDKDSLRRRSGNPAVRAGAADPSAQSEARRKLEAGSRPLLLRLAALPRWLVVVVGLVLVMAGLLLPGVPGALILLVVAAGLVWLLAVSWPVVDLKGRILRVAVLAIVLLDVVIKIKQRS